jgi:hypothetical protein
MPLNQDIRVYITDGGLGREASGRDWYTGLIFQNSTLPSGFAADDRIKRVYSLAFAEGLGITADLFPVEHYQISEYFRLSDKFDNSVWLDVGIYAIGTGLFDGSEIQLMQDNARGELRQIGVFLVDPFATSFITGANTVAESLNGDGFPTSVYLAADFADLTTPTDLRALSSDWVSTIIAQDGAGTGAALFVSEGYSIPAIGAILAATAFAKVHERIGWVGKFDLSGVTELQTLAICDGTLVEDLTDVQIDDYNTKGYTLMLYRRVAGSYVYTDAVTASLETSDFTEQRFNRTIGKTKRRLLEELAPLQNAPLYVNAKTGKLTEQTIGVFDAECRAALGTLAEKQEISIDPDTGRVPKNSVTIDPDQDVITTNKIVIGVKVVPVGAAGAIDVNLSFALSIS